VVKSVARNRKPRLARKIPRHTALLLKLASIEWTLVVEDHVEAPERVRNPGGDEEDSHGTLPWQ
jgi:hypothetical protein